MRISLLVLIFQGFPEGIAVYTLAFLLANINLNWKKIVIGGILSTTIVYFIRLFPINFGIHTAVMIAFLFIYLVKIGKATVTNSILSSLLSLLSLCLAEAACMYMFTLFGLSPQGYVSSESLKILTGLTHVLLIFIIAFLVHYYRKTRKDFNDDHSLKQTDKQSLKQ